MIDFVTLNYLSLTVYAIGAVMGVRCWAVGNELFSTGNIKSIFKRTYEGEAERLYLVVAVGVIGNVSFVRAFIGYLNQYNGHATGSNEVYFIIGHLLTGLMMIFWHEYALQRIIFLRKRLNRCKH